MEYIKVDEVQIAEMISNGTLAEMKAVKDTQVIAVELTQKSIDAMMLKGGYQTVVIDDNGKPFVETVNKNLKVGDFMVTNQIAGYNNSYVISAEKFATIYNPTENKSVFTPKPVEKTVYMIPKGLNLVFMAPWGSEMKIRGGGVLVRDGEKFYGINPEEFKATHRVL